MYTIMRIHRAKLFLSVLFYISCAGIETYFAFLLGDILDFATTGQLQKMIVRVLLVGLFLVCSLIFSRIAIGFQTSYVSRVVESLKQKLMASLYSRELVQYEKKNDSYYMNLLSNDIDVIEKDYLMPKTQLTFQIAQFVLAIIGLIYISWKALLLFVLMFFIPLCIPQLFGKKLAHLKKQESTENENFTFVIKEQIMGMSEISMNNAKTSFLEKYQIQNARQQLAKKRSTSITKFVNEISIATSLMSQIGCMAIGGYLVICKEITVGGLIAAIQLLNNVFNPINGISKILALMKGTQEIRKKIESEFDEYSRIESDFDCYDNLEVEYKNVNVWYNINEPIITGFSANIKPRGLYAIIGESGCGKTTLIKCILKRHDNYSGQILFNGRSINEITDNNIYKQVGYVSQNTFLFNDSLIENITLGQIYSKEEIDDVISKVQLREFAKKHTIGLGDSGTKVSGGERQRIAIARALIRKPKILIFDEPTASLDPDTRDAINELIFGLKDYTRIVITHDQRNNYIDRFDECISLV